MIEHSDNVFTFLAALSGPLCVCVVIGLGLWIYRDPIGKLVSSLRSVRGPAGLRADFAEQIAGQQKEAPATAAALSPPAGAPVGNVQAPITDFSKPTREVLVEAVKSYGDISNMMGNIDRELALYFMVSFVCESTYRLIFGTQLALMRQLCVGPADTATALAYYNDSAQQGNLQSFNEWIGFLTTSQLVSENNGIYSIGQSGEVFLKFVAREKYPLNKVW